MIWIVDILDMNNILEMYQMLTQYTRLTLDQFLQLKRKWNYLKMNRIHFNIYILSNLFKEVEKRTFKWGLRWLFN